MKHLSVVKAFFLGILLVATGLLMITHMDPFHVHHNGATL